MSNLRPDKALIFRIVHVDNLSWVASDGKNARAI